MIINLKPKIDANQTSASPTSFHHSFINCLEPLLMALKWSGNQNHIIEALSYMNGITSLSDFLQTMQSLHYEHTMLSISSSTIHPHLAPCLFISTDKKIYVILKIESDSIILYDGAENASISIQHPKLSGTLYIFKPCQNPESSTSNAQRTPVYSIIQPYIPLYCYAMLSSFVLSILALGVPVLILAVYDQVIPSASYGILYYYLFGIVLLLCGVVLLQWLQSKLLTFIAAKITAKLNIAIFERILSLSPSYTESASTSAQVARIKDFDTIREFLTGPLGHLFFELPFLIITFMMISLLAGWIVTIPLFTIGLFLLLSLLFKRKMSHSIERSPEKSNERQAFLLEMLNSLRTIKNYHAEDIWYKRFLSISAESSFKNFQTNVSQYTFNTLLDALMTLSGFSVVAFGAVQTIAGTMSMGALIATMILVWRLLSPLKSLFSYQTRLSTFLSSIRQINALLMIPPERNPSTLIHPIRDITGALSFERVTFRYPKAMDFSLKGISFSAQKGDVIAITGPTGSGKSTILKLILNLYQPQTGTILINHTQDIRQFDPAQLRYTLGYTPQTQDIFFGTIAQNLFMVNPSATEKELEHATRLADLFDEIISLPDKFDTYLDDQSHLHLSPGFLQRLGLARTYLKQPPIILFDEPASALDKQGEASLFTAIQYFRGRSTIFLVTHCLSHLKISDKILVLHRGELMMSGTFTQLLPKLPKELL